MFRQDGIKQRGSALGRGVVKVFQFRTLEWTYLDLLNHSYVAVTRFIANVPYNLLFKLGTGQVL